MREPGVRASFQNIGEFRDFLESRPQSGDSAAIARLAEALKAKGKARSRRHGLVDVQIRGPNFREELQLLGAPSRGFALLALLDEALSEDASARVLCCDDHDAVSRLIRDAYPHALCCTDHASIKARPAPARLSIDPASMGFPDDAFEAVVFSETLRPSADLPDALAESRRILLPGGVLLATFPFASNDEGGSHAAIDWSILAMCVGAGFETAEMVYVSDPEGGILGGDLDGIFVLRCL